MKNSFKILLDSKLFRGVDESEAEAMLGCLSPIERRYKKGEYIYCCGEEISSVGLMLCGAAHVIKEDYWGNRAILSEITEGGIFGEAYACSDRRELSVSVVAARDSAVMFIDVGRILTMCPSACGFHTRLIQNLIAVLADKNIHLTGKIEHMSRRRLRDKVLAYLSDVSKQQASAEFTIPFNRQELADYLSVDRSALSNELCRLRDEGILEFEHNHFRLL